MGVTTLEKMSVPFTPPMVSEDEIQEVVKVLRSGWIGTGPRVQEFEEKLAHFLGIEHVLAVSSGTAALHLSLIAAGVGTGDEVITTPMTFAATANVVVHTGARPVFADIRKDDWNIDPSQIKKRLTKRTKAIIPVHLGGMPCDLDEIMEIARARDLVVIEDAAHAIGAKYRGKRVGSSGNLVCFSFYPTKNITTIEGGAIATSNGDQTKLIGALRMHGQSADAWKRYSSGKADSYQVTHAGFKYNLTDVQAAIGLKQLEKIDRFLDDREKVARVYLDALKDVPGIQLPVSEEDQKDRVWHLFSVLIKSEVAGIDRQKVMALLNEQGIGTGIHYEAVHLQPFYRQNFGGKEKQFPGAEYVSSRTLSLPLTAKVTEDQASYVASALKSILKRAQKRNSS